MSKDKLTIEAVRALRDNLIVALSDAVQRFEDESGCRVEELVICRTEEDLGALRGGGYTMGDHERFGAYAQSLVFPKVKL